MSRFWSRSGAAVLAVVVLSVAATRPVAAQGVIVTPSCYCPPVVSCYTPPVVSYYAPPAVTYYRAPTVAYYSAPAVSYYAPPVVTTYAAPVTTYYAPPAVTTYYRYGLFGRRVAATTYYYGP
ncbi:MAG: hypothetical protein ACK4RK_00015 [Gemmataceae bacterium]